MFSVILGKSSKFRYILSEACKKCVGLNEIMRFAKKFKNILSRKYENFYMGIKHVVPNRKAFVDYFLSM